MYRGLLSSQLKSRAAGYVGLRGLSSAFPSSISRPDEPLNNCFVADVVDSHKLFVDRLEKVQHELVSRNLGACVLYDPINIRYATGSTNMQVITLHLPMRYCFVPASGKAILFDFHGCDHLSSHLSDTIGELRHATSWFYFEAGNKVESRAAKWADEIAGLVKEHCGADNLRVAIDRCDPAGVFALQKHGVEVVDGQEPLERARMIKLPAEIVQMKAAVQSCQRGMARMHNECVPGMTENQLWALLHQVNIEDGGEWIETRLLSSGHRTNPWFQQCSDKVIKEGELVGYDTDLVGPHGFTVDISRTFLCGDRPATDEQKRLYNMSYNQMHYNMELMKPGRSFRDIAMDTFKLPEEFMKKRYCTIAHGVGLVDEYPIIYYPEDYDSGMVDDDILQPNMVLSVESYVGSENGTEGVKLEEMILVTEEGFEKMSDFPYEENLM